MTDPIVSKETFLKSQLPENTMEVPGVGTIRIRGLSRAEVLKFTGLDSNERENAWLAAGIVDPDLSEEDVRAWRESAISKTVNTVVEAILELSGMLERSEAELRRSFPGGQGDEVRAPAGGTAGDDGDEAEVGDAPG